MQKDETYLNDKEAARYLRLSVQTIRNWRTKNKGPTYIKIGRAVRYALEDLDAFMRSNRVQNVQ